MVRYGFIHTKEDIKFLVLFAMDLLPFPVSFSTIVDLTTWCDEGFGYFELSEAFYEMVPTGHIEEIPDKGETLYAITEKGREATRIFEKQLPYPVREAAQRSALRVVRQIRRDAGIHTAVTEHGPNDLTVRMEMEQVFAVEMNVVSHGQAAMLERTFKENAEAVYQTLLTAMTKTTQTRKKRKTLKHMKQLGVLLACCVGGSLLSLLLRGLLPGNVLGLTLLLALLIFGAVRLHHVESVADFLLQNMAFFFLPAMLGVLEIWNDIKSEALAILAVCLLTTLCTAAATALTVHIVFRLQHRETEEAFDHD